MSEETQDCFCLLDIAASKQVISQLREQLPRVRAQKKTDFFQKQPIRQGSG